MVGIVIATHGHLAQEMVSTAEQIIGPMGQVATCSIEPSASPEEIRSRISGAVSSVDSGEGVIVLADLLGGTPCNQSLMLCSQRSLEVLTGVNLPMLLKASSLRNSVMALPEMAQVLTQYGQKNILCMTEKLRAVPVPRSA